MPAHEDLAETEHVEATKQVDPDDETLADTERIEANKQPDDARPSGAGYLGGCALCGVQMFINKEAALAHGNSPEHAQKAAERRATRSSQPARQGAEDHRNRAVPARSKPQQNANPEEYRPWVYRIPNSDELNLGSYAFAGVVGFVELAHDLLAMRTPEDTSAFTMDDVGIIGGTLLNSADEAQRSIRKSGTVDRMDISHTRARGAIRTALRSYPLPTILDDEHIDAWAEELVAHASAILKVSLDLAYQHDRTLGQ